MKLLGLIHYVTEFGFYHEGSAQSLGGFKQGRDMIRSGLRVITLGSVGHMLEGAQ